jgi:hypothetical protein
VIWHNDKTGQATLRSLVAYDNLPLGINRLVAPLAASLHLSLSST